MVTLSDGALGLSSRTPADPIKKLRECPCTAYMVSMSALPVESAGVDQKGFKMRFGWP